jgi:hypothetical protein
VKNRSRASVPRGPLEPARGSRQAGAYRGELWIAPDFDDLPEDLLAAFHGGSA